MKIYILEDEERIRQHILQVVEPLSYVQILGYAADVATAAKEIPMLQPELILADISLKDGNSFQLFEQIGHEDFQIIFLTAYDQYAIQALNMGALGYLLKPIDDKALVAMLDKCFKQQLQRFNRKQLNIANSLYNDTATTKHIALKNVESIDIVAVQDIVYCRSEGAYTTFHLDNKSKIIVSKIIKEYETILTPYGFFRSHQSYLVNLNYIKKYFREGHLVLQNGEKIPVSSRKKEEVMRYLNGLG